VLCQHHELGDFDCGEPIQNLGIASRVGTFFDPSDVVILVAHENDVIRGFLSLCDLELRLDEDSDVTERCFFFAAFGVDQRWVGSGVGASLIQRSYTLRRLRRHRNYAATVATTIHNPEFEPRLRALRFRPVPGTDSTFWYRRPRS